MFRMVDEVGLGSYTRVVVRACVRTYARRVRCDARWGFFHCFAFDAVVYSRCGIFFCTNTLHSYIRVVGDGSFYLDWVWYVRWALSAQRWDSGGGVLCCACDYGYDLERRLLISLVRFRCRSADAVRCCAFQMGLSVLKYGVRFVRVGNSELSWYCIE